MVGPQVVRVVESSPKLYRRGLQILGATVKLVLKLIYGNETLNLDIRALIGRTLFLLGCRYVERFFLLKGCDLVARRYEAQLREEVEIVNLFLDLVQL